MPVLRLCTLFSCCLCSCCGQWWTCIHTNNGHGRVRSQNCQLHEQNGTNTHICFCCSCCQFSSCTFGCTLLDREWQWKCKETSENSRKKYYVPLQKSVLEKIQLQKKNFFFAFAMFFDDQYECVVDFFKRKLMVRNISATALSLYVFLFIHLTLYSAKRIDFFNQ